MSDTELPSWEHLQHLTIRRTRRGFSVELSEGYFGDEDLETRIVRDDRLIKAFKAWLGNAA